MSSKNSLNGHGHLHALLDKDAPFELRQIMLLELASSDDESDHETLEKLFASARQGSAEAVANDKLKEAEALVDELKRGPLRPANYLGKVSTKGSATARVAVRLSNGDPAYPIVADEELLGQLRPGDPVLVDAQARCVLCPDTTRMETGEVARLVRRLDGNQVMISLRDHEEVVMWASPALMDQLSKQSAQSGQQLLVCTRRQMVLDVLPPEQGLSNYRYLVREPVPDVIIGRDIGDPPRYMFDVLDHLERELTNPQLARRYRIRRAQTKMLAGVSGSGKTLSIEATIRASYELMSRHTGVPLEQLPQRVMRLRSSQLLSKWLGDSDKAIDRFFDEVLELADEKFVAPDGTEYELPVFVLIEECDSIGRERGGAGEQVYDRIQGTLLERLDANSRRFGSRLVVVLCTTNVPHLLDPAFLRRTGGTIEHFGRLSRRGLMAVLEKHVAGLPIASEYGRDSHERQRRLVRHAIDWFFSPQGHDPGQVELTYVGSAQSVIMYRRDFLTGSLVDRAVQQAGAAACRSEGLGEAAGITREMLLAAFDQQIRSLVDQISVHNAQNYLTLPDGVRVAQVRRIEQPKLKLYELERAAG